MCHWSFVVCLRLVSLTVVWASPFRVSIFRYTYVSYNVVRCNFSRRGRRTILLKTRMHFRQLHIRWLRLIECCIHLHVTTKKWFPRGECYAPNVIGAASHQIRAEYLSNSMMQAHNVTLNCIAAWARRTNFLLWDRCVADTNSDTHIFDPASIRNVIIVPFWYRRRSQI